jgi:hypothetical protein
MKFREQFGSKYGDFVLCCDSQLSWRKDIFPFYKIKRKKQRDDSPIDWAGFQTIFSQIKAEFRDHLPYRLVEAEGAEGDDVISVLCEWNAQRTKPEPVLIFSSDKDFLQLQKYPEVQQWDKLRERWLICDNPLFFLREKIIRGDSGDGVPNIFSPENSFAVGVRQKPVMTAKVEEWKQRDPVFNFTGEVLERYERNRLLMDLSMIPVPVKAKIANQFLTNAPKPRSGLYNYFVNSRLPELITETGAF